MDDLKDIRDRMSKLPNDELIRILNIDFDNYREEVIEIVKEELKKRDIKEIDADKIEELRKSKLEEVPTGWLEFYNYWLIPGGIFFNLIIAPLTIQIEYPGVMFIFGLIWSILLAFLLYGLHKRRLWGWKLNWVVLVIGVLLNSLEYYTMGVIFYFVVLILGVLIWVLPNYVYFKKRRHLFT